MYPTVLIPVCTHMELKLHGIMGAGKAAASKIVSHISQSYLMQISNKISIIHTCCTYISSTKQLQLLVKTCVIIIHDAYLFLGVDYSVDWLPAFPDGHLRLKKLELHIGQLYTDRMPLHSQLISFVVQFATKCSFIRRPNLKSTMLYFSYLSASSTLYYPSYKICGRMIAIGTNVTRESQRSGPTAAFPSTAQHLDI